MDKQCCKELRAVLGLADESCLSDKTSAKERNRTFVIDKRKLPNEQFCRIKVDGCLINDKITKRCDYVFIRCNKMDYYFVELKGSETGEAFKQLKSTIKYFKEKLPTKMDGIFAFIVTNRIPSNSNQKFNNLKKKFYKELGVIPKIGTLKVIKQL